MALRIEDYAMIGNCHSAALVGKDGSIDWLCWPRFDSAACFASLLGGEERGRWLVCAVDAGASRRRQYRDGTLILETEFRTATGAVNLIDFMSDVDGRQSVVRIVQGLEGRVPMRMELILRFDYGLTIPWVVRTAEHELDAIAGPDRVTLRTPVDVRGENLRSVAEFEVAAGERVPFVLTLDASFRSPQPAIDAEAALQATEGEWTAWSAKCLPVEPWTGLVKRSLSTLRGLTYALTGGMVAAPTTSLPEKIGGQRNWDYRYCWVRDATFTLLAMMNAGYYDEAAAWRDWLSRAIAGSPEQLQILYGVAGERLLPEREIPWLEGYERSSPVRVGNLASEQLQLDIYGELTDAMTQARKGGLPRTERGTAQRKALLDGLEKIWRNPDEGIWEIRGEPRHFVHSKVMAWLAFARAVEDEALPVDSADRERWRRNAEEIHAEVCEHGFDAKQGCFVQSYGSRLLDASLLMLPIVGFLPADDERLRGTVRAVEQRLLVDGLVLRYETEHGIDGLPPGEGAFLPCSFWLADALILMGRVDDARQLFERLTGLCNDVGLLAEEYDPVAGRMLGNFPQAFSHVALVNTAFNLSRAQGHGSGEATGTGRAVHVQRHC